MAVASTSSCIRAIPATVLSTMALLMPMDSMEASGWEYGYASSSGGGVGAVSWWPRYRHELWGCIAVSAWWLPPYVVVVLVVVWAMVVYGPPSLVPLAPWPSLRMLPTAMA